MMDNYQGVVNSRQHNFRFIPFVTPSEEINVENATTSHVVSSSNLSGEEARLFYKEVILSPSSPSVSQLSYVKKQSENSTKNAASTIYDNRRTIFYHAQNGNIEGIKYHLSNGCDIDVQDMYGWTSLMCATCEGHYAVVEYLIKCGANLSIKNKQDKTALDIASNKKYNSLINILKNGAIENVSSTDSKTEEKVKHCYLCDCTYVQSSLVHQRSIAHLFNSKKAHTSTYYHIPENNKGFQIMLKKGWDKNKGLGINSKGRKFPIKTVLKNDRACIGGRKEVSRVTHFGPKDYNSVKKHNQSTLKLAKERKYSKRNTEKLKKRDRKKEIDFRRQFHLEC